MSMTLQEAIRLSGTPTIMAGSSIKAAEEILAGEPVAYAIVANCTISGLGTLHGVVAVTDRRVMFCNRVLGQAQATSLFYQAGIGVGNISGPLTYKLPLSGSGTSMTVELGNRRTLSAFQSALLESFMASPDHGTLETIWAEDLPATTPLTKRGQAKQRIKANKAAGVACCPKCGSTSLSTNKKGFGFGKAAVGSFVAGPVGLVGGTLGANKLVVTCLNCGHKFKPGQ